MEPTDRELLIRFAVARDEPAFVTLVRRYERLVRAAGGRVLRDVHLTEDVFQATFLVLAARARTLCHQHHALGPWLHTVASNAALQLRRSRLRASRREQQVQPVTEDSVLSELLGMLDEELQRLNAEDREAIVLCHLQGLTQDEAAGLLGVSKSTLRRRLNRGMETLRGRFRRRGLLVPMFAVLWGAVTSQETDAAEEPLLHAIAGQGEPLPWGDQTETALQRLSLNSQTLSRRMLAMSRWNPWRWVAALGLSACVLLGVSGLPRLAQSSAAEKTEKVAKVNTPKPSEPKPEPVAQSLPSPGGAAQNADADGPSPPAKLASVKKPKGEGGAKGKAGKAGKANAGGGTVQPAAPVVAASKNGNAIAIAGGSAGGSSGGMTGGATSTNSNGNFSGTVNINGKEYKTNNPAEFQCLLQMQQASFPQIPGFPNLANGFPKLGGNGAIAGGNAGGGGFAGGATSVNGPDGFKGTVTINGKEQTFTNQADFDKAVKGLNSPQIPIK